MTFERLRIADWVAFAAALALLFVMALDWYSTPMGREARRIEQQNQPHGALGGEIAREVQSEARLAADKAERNAWQADGGIDRVILVALLLTAGLGVAAAFFRAGNFSADGNGNLSGGVEDVNDSSGPTTTPISFVGTYTIAADGRGTMQFAAERASSSNRS